jgi:hypothetical protein
MIELLNKINRKYDLNIGNHCFSPIMQASVALSMEYIASIENVHSQEPFHICFPVKEYSSLWLSIALLRNFFLNDYVCHNPDRIEDLGLKVNDKIEIFGCVVMYNGINNDNKVQIKFKDDHMIFTLKNSCIPYINKTNRKALNTHSTFIKKRKEQILQRNAISKIIEPEDDVVINQQLLISKVLVVAGRGNTNKFLDKMKSTEVHNESLSSIFQVNNDLIIKPDLDDYKSCFDSEYSGNILLFKKFFLASFEKAKNLLNEPFVENYVRLKQYVDNDQFDDEHFLRRYDEFLENLERSDHQILFNVRARYPGISMSLPKRLKAIIVNDIELLENYTETIKGFISKRIPVIVVSDRHIGSKALIDLYSNYFSKHLEALRINWNKKKISAIQSKNTSEEYLDQHLWDSCKRYAGQQIEIEIFEEYPLDTIMPEIQRLIFRLEGFEELKKAYWKFFQPAAYGVKNGFSNNIPIQLWAKKFEVEFVKVRNLLDKEVSDIIYEGLRLIKKYYENTKKINRTIPVFRQNYGELDGNEVFVPRCNDLPTINSPSVQTNSIQFVGFPLNEPLCKVLLNSVCEYFIPEIKILSWPNEGDLAYQYLFRRLHGAYFTDYLKKDWGIPEELLLKDDQDFENEIISFLKKTGKVQERGGSTIEDEDIVFTINAYKYNQYQEKNSSTDKYLVKCNTVDFDDNQFMFLPHTSKILAQIETADGSIKFKRASFNELKTGYKIYEYKFDRTQRMALLKKKLGSHEAFKTLYLWRDRLEYLYRKFNIRLENELSAVMNYYGLSGNPSSANIQRWLHDEEMLSPEDDNLRTIFTAYAPYGVDGSEGEFSVEEVELKEVELFVTKVRKAYKIINSFNIGLSFKIKKLIMDRLNMNDATDEKRFQINIQGFDLSVAAATVIGLQKNDKLVDYHCTRRILV